MDADPIRLFLTQYMNSVNKAITATIVVAGVSVRPAGAEPASPTLHSNPIVSVSMQARFVADRVVLDVVTANGARLALYTDTGGGGAMRITCEAAGRAGLKVHPLEDPDAQRELGAGAGVTSAPVFRGAVPQVSSGIRVLVESAEPRLRGWPEAFDGALGEKWFAGHVWTWDYPDRKLILRPMGWIPGPDAHRFQLGFRMEGGKRTFNFPSISMRVDGHDIPMLLDTGAETWLTVGGLAALHDGGPAVRATSMIAHSVFESWRLAHPDWRVVDDAQQVSHARMIEVPQVELAGWVVGPVWFTERPDWNFRVMMSSMTDVGVEGSIGGNAFSSLQVTIDYPAAQVWVVKP